MTEIISGYPLGEEPHSWARRQVLVDKYHPNSLNWARPVSEGQPKATERLEHNPNQSQVVIPRGRERVQLNSRLNPHGCDF